MSQLTSKDLTYQDKEAEELTEKIMSLFSGVAFDVCEDALRESLQLIKSRSTVS